MRPALSPLSSRVTPALPGRGPRDRPARGQDDEAGVEVVEVYSNSSSAPNSWSRTALRRSSLSAIARIGADERDEQQLQERVAALRPLLGLAQRLGRGAERLAGALEITLQLLVVEQRRRLLGVRMRARRHGGRRRRPRAGCRGAPRPRSGAGRRGARPRPALLALSFARALARHSDAPLGSQVLFPASIYRQTAERFRERAGSSAARLEGRRLPRSLT